MPPSVVARANFTAAGADCPTSFAGPDLHFQEQSSCQFMQSDLAIHKTFVKLNPIQYRFYLHPVSPPLALEILVDLHNAKKENGMLYFQVPSGKNPQPLQRAHRPDGNPQILLR